jgi:SAM-dependent methyltransferase
MLSQDTDRAWDYYGEVDPYFGVISSDSFRAENLSSERKKAFFDSGDAHIQKVLGIVTDYVDPSFMPATADALDFGCGVGRLVIPLAKRCRSVTGIDVSPHMLEEAAKNCREHGVENVRLQGGCERIVGSYDLINSHIVLQHIPTERGLVILSDLIGALKNGGVGILHLTYHRRGSTFARLKYAAGSRVPCLFGLRNVLRGLPYNRPMMQMNEYDLNRVARLLQESDCHHAVIRFTSHDVALGIVFLFQKRRVASL